MNLFRLLKSANSKKILAIALFFSLFFGGFGLVVLAQYEGDFGVYDYQQASYDYYDYGYDYYSYNYDYDYYVEDYGYQPYSYSIEEYYPTVMIQPEFHYGYHIYPPLYDPVFPVYQTPTIPPLYDPVFPVYSSMSYLPNLISSPPSVTRAESMPISKIPTGPENIFLWILAISLALSIVVYLLLLKIRLIWQLNSGGGNTVLEKRIKEIKIRELKPDTNDF